jgi:hypothetical protein
MVVTELGPDSPFYAVEMIGSLAAQQAERLHALENTFPQAFAIVESVDGINGRLRAARREDLAINDRYEGVPELTDIGAMGPASIGNFCTGFNIYTQVGNDLDGPVPEGYQSVPITEEELLRLRTGTFDGVSKGLESHANRPAFLRMLVLFPDFTVPLVVGASDHRLNSGNYQLDMFAAYQLMAHLVDKSDNPDFASDRPVSFPLAN